VDGVANALSPPLASSRLPLLQGVDGVTNAYLNSLWLVNRLGTMANAGVTVMARQSLVGYNYSLLGNWPKVHTYAWLSNTQSVGAGV
jgi:hypothetical protein